MVKNSVILISIRPHRAWCDFLEGFEHYDVYIVVDDERFDLGAFRERYKKLNFVQTPDDGCGPFRNSSFLQTRPVNGWDKAIELACRGDHAHYWFIEDDVFVPSENALLSLDRKFPEEDLLSNRCWSNQDGRRHEWHWHAIDPRVGPPWYAAMVCAVRASSRLMGFIGDHAKAHGELYFIEAMFPTVSAKNGLNHTMPWEMGEIHWRNDFDEGNIKNLMSHPVKYIQRHQTLREHLRAKAEGRTPECHGLRVA